MSRLLLIAAMLFFAATHLYSQAAQSPKFNDFDSDEAYVAQVQEVYGEDIAYSNTRLTGLLVKLLEERIKILPIPAAEGKDFPLLSSLPAMNKNNPDVVPFVAGQYDPASFNPLWYEFNFFDKEDQWFRIDGTNYVLYIDHFTTTK